MIALKKGDRVSEYILEEPLGRGGFGEVWKARHHLWDDREVAVKVPTSPEAVHELSNEGTLQASLDHPGIARTLGMDPSATPPYFITEFVPGRNLRRILEDDGPLSVDLVRDVLDQILEILEYAHGKGVVHQDIKPENILRSDDGAVKLTDFGLGQTVNGESILLSASLRTEGGQIGGTFPYIAPEIRDGLGRPDGRADLYSLGIVLFELLTGQRPAGGEVPSDLRGDLPAWCDEVFRGLYTRRENRFEDVRAVRERLVAGGLAAGGTVADASRAGESAGGGPRVTPLTPPRRRIPLAEASAILGMSEREIQHWIKRGKLSPYSIDGVVHLDAAEVQRFQKERPPVTVDGRPPVDDPEGESSSSHGVPVTDGKFRSAGVLVRTGAMIVDFFALSGLLAISPLPLVPPLMPSWMLVALLYFSLGHGLWGQTFGKMIFGIRVIRQSGQRLNVFDGFVRTINYLLSMFPMGLGFVAILFSRRRLALHDLLCGTRVVHIDRK